MRTAGKIASLLVVFVLLIPCGIQASEKKEKKKKKEKKEYVWKLPKLTKNEDFDTYLLTCDTLNSRIQAYNDSIVYYKVVRANTGEKDDTGKPLYQYAVVDDKGNIRNTGRILLQSADLILTGTSIILDCASLSLLTASATATLPSLGLLSFSYAKYIKAGPVIVGKGAKEIKEIVASCKTQAKAINSLKKSSTNKGENQDVLMLSSEMPEGIETIDKTKEEMDELVNNTVVSDTEGADQIDDSVFD
jgi:hypothetical protein